MFSNKFHSLLHLCELSVKLGYLVGIVLDEVPRSLHAIQPGSNHRGQLALGRRQLFPEIRDHLSDVLKFARLFVFVFLCDCNGAGGRVRKTTKIEETVNQDPRMGETLNQDQDGRKRDQDQDKKM